MLNRTPRSSCNCVEGHYQKVQTASVSSRFRPFVFLLLAVRCSLLYPCLLLYLLLALSALPLTFAHLLVHCVLCVRVFDVVVVVVVLIGVAGMWSDIFQFISFLAVITNALLIVFDTNLIDKWTNDDLTTKIWTFVAAEVCFLVFLCFCVFLRVFVCFFGVFCVCCVVGEVDVLMCCCVVCAARYPRPQACPHRRGICVFLFECVDVHLFAVCSLLIIRFSLFVQIVDESAEIRDHMARQVCSLPFFCHSALLLPFAYCLLLTCRCCVVVVCSVS